MTPIADLAARPSFEQATATFTAMDAEIREAITGIRPSAQWYLSDAGIQSACAKPYDHSPGSSTGDALHQGTGVDDAVFYDAAHRR